MPLRVFLFLQLIWHHQCLAAENGFGKTLAEPIRFADDDPLPTLESIYPNYEKFDPTFSEPVVITQMPTKISLLTGSADKTTKMVYRYPRLTSLSFFAFNSTPFKILLQRQDAVYGAGVGLSERDEKGHEDRWEDGPEDTALPVVESICLYHARFSQADHINDHINERNSPINLEEDVGVLNLCEQRLDGLLRRKGEGFRLWTKDEGEKRKHLIAKVGIVEEEASTNETTTETESTTTESETISFEGDDDFDVDDNATLTSIRNQFESIVENKTRIRQGGDNIKDSTIMRRFVELYILVDKKLSSSFKNDRTKVNQRVASLVAFINVVWKPLNVKFFVIHIEYGFSPSKCSKSVYSSNNNKFSSNYLSCVKEYRSKMICREPNGPMKLSDHTMLVTGQQFCHGKHCILGKSRTYSVCNWDSSVSISSAPSSSDLWEVGLTISHELGHSLGAQHDWGLRGVIARIVAASGARPSRGCTCTLPSGKKLRGRTKKCIMSPLIDSRMSWVWSDCSFADIDFTYEAGLHKCLYNRRDKYDSIEKLMQTCCGNGKIDAGEQCENKGTGCCTDRCVLKEGAECNIGPCCVGCKFRKKGEICNKKRDDDCDMNDVCTGDSGDCRVRHKPNGEVCVTRSHEKAFCYRGNCRGQTEGCTDLVGEGNVADLKTMRNPTGREGGANGCVANPCGFGPGRWRVDQLIDKAMEECEEEEENVCGGLVCRGKRKRMADGAIGNVSVNNDDNNNNNNNILLRSDFHEIMRRRFGEKRWKRIMTHSGILDDDMAERIRQGGDLTTAQESEILKGFSEKFLVDLPKGEIFAYFPIYSHNPGVAPSGSPCADGKKVCHNGRCLTQKEFKDATYDPLNDKLSKISEVEKPKKKRKSCGVIHGSNVFSVVIVVVVVVFIFG